MVSVCGHVFIKRLSELQELSATDECALLNVMVPGRTSAKGLDVIADGSAPTSVSIIVSGAACRYKVLSGGQRQVLGVRNGCVASTRLRVSTPGPFRNGLGAIRLTKQAAPEPGPTLNRALADQEARFFSIRSSTASGLMFC